MFVLWRVTHDEKWREYGWKIFQNIYANCRIESGGFSGLKDAYANPVELDDYQPSFFIAETLKYLLLMFQDPPEGETDGVVLPLDQYVFTTEAHPMSLDMVCPDGPDTGNPTRAGEPFNVNMATGATTTPPRVSSACTYTGVSVTVYPWDCILLGWVLLLTLFYKVGWRRWCKGKG